MMISSLSSCTTFKAEGLTFSSFDSDVLVLGKFSESRTVHELFGTPGGANLLNITSTAMSDKVSGIIWKEIQNKGGNAARNITITYSAGPLAYIANAITFGIWAPAKLNITGDIIKTSSKTAQIDTEQAIEIAVADFR